MAAPRLTTDECRLVLESLGYTRASFERTQYPSYEFRRSRLDEVDAVISKVRAIRDALPHEANRRGT